MPANQTNVYIEEEEDGADDPDDDGDDGDDDGDDPDDDNDDPDDGGWRWCLVKFLCLSANEINVYSIKEAQQGDDPDNPDDGDDDNCDSNLSVML